ncbi:hypothetical protein [Haliscomenobacter sp.]|uniref:hypothetical protein n=1 Tax=Haliscomenobacter sp. TaxID=2717303 RepID=UPI003593AD2F
MASFDCIAYQIQVYLTVGQVIKLKFAKPWIFMAIWVVANVLIYIFPLKQSIHVQHIVHQSQTVFVVQQAKSCDDYNENLVF